MSRRSLSPALLLVILVAGLCLADLARGDERNGVLDTGDMAEFDEDGPACGYNALVSDYASIWWKQDASDPNLIRFPDHHRQLMARLKRFMGRAHSMRA